MNIFYEPKQLFTVHYCTALKLPDDRSDSAQRGEVQSSPSICFQYAQIKLQ